MANEQISDQTEYTALADNDIFAIQKAADGVLYKIKRSTIRDNLVASLVQGDVLYHNGTNLVRLAAGTAGQGLTTGGAAANPAWAGLTTQGDIEYHNGTTRTRLAAGVSGQVLKTFGAGANPAWGYAGIPIIFMGNSFSPADATTYYFGNPYTITVNSTADGKRVYFHRPGTITRANIVIHNLGGTQGSNQQSTMSFRLNNTTDSTLSSTVTADAASGAATFQTVTGLSIAVAANDYAEIKWVTPTWVTNPTNVVPFVQLFLE